MPEDDIRRLRKDIDSLKDDMQTRDSLARSVNSLLKIFEEASKDLKMDTRDAVLISEKMDNIMRRLERLETHNEKIAKGIVAIADMLEEKGFAKVQKGESKSILASATPPPAMGSTKELPTYDIPKDERKKTFLNFKS